MKWLKKVSSTPLTSIARVVDNLQTKTNERTNAPSIHAVREAIKSNWLSIYPIGSIYMSVNTLDPSVIFGGTWVQVKDKFLLASGDIFTNGETGGEINHMLTVNEMPAHTHNVIGGTEGLPSGTYIALNPQEVGTAIGSTPATYCGGTTGLNIEGEAQQTGGGQAHNNMPPYLVVNVWYRTA